MLAIAIPAFRLYRGIPRRHSSNMCAHTRMKKHTSKRLAFQNKITNSRALPTEMKAKDQCEQLMAFQLRCNKQSGHSHFAPSSDTRASLSSHLVKRICHLFHRRQDFTSEATSASRPVEGSTIFQKQVVVIEPPSTQKSTISFARSMEHLGFACWWTGSEVFLR